MVATFQSSVQWVEIGLLAATVVVVKSVARYMTDSSSMEVPMTVSSNLLQAQGRRADKATPWKCG